LELTEEFLCRKKIAVAGSYCNTSKVAYRILKKLTSEGHEVFPVTLSIKEVEGIKCYKSVLDIPGQIDAIDLVTPPPATEKIVRDCLKKGIKMVWMQPGAESEEAIKFCEENNIKVVHNTCVLTF